MAGSWERESHHADRAPESSVLPTAAVRPVIPALLGMMVGVAVGEYFPNPGGWAWWGIGAGVLLSAVNAVRRHPGLTLLPLFFAGLGYFLLQPWATPELPPKNVSRFSGPEKWWITGVVDATPAGGPHRQSFVLRAESLADTGGAFAVGGKIRVTVAGAIPALAAGDLVRFQSRLRPFRNFNNPGGFDYRRYMAFKGIRARAFCLGKNLTVVAPRPPSGFQAWVTRGRDAVAAAIDGQKTSRAQAVLKALVVGQREGIGPELRDAFNRAGIGHLLAISGLHIGIVASVCFGFFKWLLSRIEVVLWRAWTRKGAAVFCLVAILGYGLLAGMSPSTQRAVIMVAVFLSAFLVEREPDLFNTLAVAALVILMVHPPALFAVSFQLSFSAVFWIVFGLRRAAAGSRVAQPSEKGGWGAALVQRAAIFFWVSFFAFLGTLPLVMYYFNQVSLVGLAANFVFVPLIGFMVVPLGVAGVALLPLSPVLAEQVFVFDTALLDWGLTGVEWIARLPWAAVKTVTPSLLEIICFYAVLWGCLQWVGQKEARSAEKAAAASLWPGGRKYISLLVLMAALLTGAGDAGYWLYRRFWQPELRVTVLDVQQGSCALVEFPGGECMLIDGGGFPDNERFDIGARVLAPFLWRQKIRTLDTVVLSHPDSDHLNGLLYILQHFNVRRVWSNHHAAQNTGYRTFQDLLAQRAIPHPDFGALPRGCRIGGVGVEILYPPGDFLEQKELDAWRNTNNSSLVIRLRLGDHVFLFPGDIMAAAEAELVGSVRPARGNLTLIAPHHGSRTSSTQAFLDWSRPDNVVISSRGDGRGKRPHPSVLARYRALKARIYATYHHGAVTFETDGRHLQVHPFLKADAPL